MAAARSNPIEQLAGWSWATLAESPANDELTPLLQASTRPTSTARVATKIGKINQPASLLADRGRTRSFTLAEELVALESLHRFPGSIAPHDFPVLFSRSYEASPAPADDERPDIVAAHLEAQFLRGLIYADILDCGPLLEAAAKSLAENLHEHTDTDGTPHAELLPVLASWLAVHVRAVSHVTQTSPAPRKSLDTSKSNSKVKSLTSTSHRELLAAVLEQSARLIRKDGRLAHSIHETVAIRHVYQVASQCVDLPPHGAAHAFAKGATPASKSRPIGKAERTSEEWPSSQSDWAHTAVLRAGWEPAGAACTIAYHRPWPDVELSSGPTTLLRGSCGIEAITPEGQLELAESWSCVCWNADEDGDYAELQMLGPNKLSLERQAFLSRRQGFALFGETLRGKAAGEYILKTALPVGPGLTVAPDRLTREWQLLRQGKLVARIFPLELTQEKLHSTPHLVEVVDGQLICRYVASGKAVYAATIIVWEPKLLKRPAIWRKLTVTEDSRIVRGDEAAGYRLKLGDFQLVVYRSLKYSEIPRAVLGHHTAKESLIGQLDTTTGDVAPILLVE